MMPASTGNVLSAFLIVLTELLFLTSTESLQADTSLVPNHFDIGDLKNSSSSWPVVSGNSNVFYGSTQFKTAPYSIELYDLQSSQGNIKHLDIFPNHESGLKAINPRISSAQIQYGEIEWIAKMHPSLTVLTVFRIGPLTSVETEKGTIRFEHPAVELVVGEKSLRAEVFHKGFQSPDISSRPHTDWISYPYELHGDNLTETYRRYLLSWNETQMVWTINDTVVFRLNNKLKIPHTKLPIVVYQLAPPNSDKFHEGGLHVWSVTVTQLVSEVTETRFRRRVPSNLEFSDVVTYNFTDLTYIDYVKWQRMEGATPDRLIRYIPECANMMDGFLRITTGPDVRGGVMQTAAYHPVGRIDSKEDGFVFGEVEWLARIQVAAGRKYVLSLENRKCGENEGLQTCELLTSPSIAFVFLDSDIIQGIIYQIDQGTNIWDASTSTGGVPYPSTKNGVALFHRYRILWTEKLLVFYINDKEILRVEDVRRIPQTTMHLSMKSGLMNESQFATVLQDHVTCTDPGMDIAHIMVRKQKATVPLLDLTDDESILLHHNTNQRNGVTRNGAQSGIAKTVVPAVVVPLLAVCAIVIGCCAYWRVRKPRHKQGRMLKNLEMRRRAVASTYSSMCFGTVLTGDAESDQRFLRYAHLMEVSRDTVELSDKILGKGEFGVVFKGQAHCLPTIAKGPTDVAIKTVSQTADEEQQKLFADELRIMCKMGRHLNVVNLLGVVTKGVPLLLLEYCRFGSLLTYLADFRDGRVYEQVDESGAFLAFDEAEMNEQWLIARQHVKEMQSSTDMKAGMLSTTDLIAFGHQIARGMEHLTSRGIIHRDLAARNVLVADNRILKISDFGLAKIGEATYTVSNLLVPLPVLWMPPEAISGGTFSHSSDVWSFGILLWEIFTLGKMPYGELNMKQLSISGFAGLLQDGHHMTRPHGAPTDVYKIMELCWTVNAEARPTFKALQKRLDNLFCSCGQTTSRNYISLKDSNAEMYQLIDDLLNNQTDSQSDQRDADV